jgi:hypothetical protein
MFQPKKERWLELCQQAAIEQDPVRMLELMTQINNLLEEKEQRLEAERRIHAHPSEL